MKQRKDTDVQNIKAAGITKSCSIGGKTITFRLQNVFTGEVNGREELLDEVLIDNMLEQIAKAVKGNCSRYNPVPDEIIIGSGGSREISDKDSQEKPKEAEREIIESYEPRFSLEQVALNEEVRAKVRTAISAVRHRKKMSEEWGMSEYFTGSRAVILNFYGKAGTGKSMTAEAVAKTLGKKVYRINYSELESKYVGETPKNIRKAFECATRDGAVLIFDEADSFLGKRLTSVTQSADYGVNITRSVLLMELEKFTGVVVFTTNLISNYDEAFKRRILLSVYFEMPDKEAREAIWKLHLGAKMPLHKEVTAEGLAARYENVSGADIKDMVFYAALYALEQEKETLDFPVFDYAHAAIRERYEDKGSPGGFQVVSTETITEEQYRKEINNQEG